MLRTFIFAEPKKNTLTPRELEFLKYIFEYWPICSKNISKSVIETIIRNIQQNNSSFLDNTTKEQQIQNIKEIYKKRKLGPYSNIEWYQKQCKTIQTMIDYEQFKAFEKALKKYPLSKLNKIDRHGNTLLTRQCLEQNDKIVEILIKHPGIRITDKDIGYIANHQLKDEMMMKNMSKQFNSSKSSSSSYTAGESKTEVREECGHYSIDQGDMGICYIVSVITLFRNERSIIQLLKSKERPKPLMDILNILEADYSNLKTKKTCPKLPPMMTRAITQNRSTRSALTKNGGNAFTLLMYIMNSINFLAPDISVYKRHAISPDGVFPGGHIVGKEDTFRNHTTAKIGYIDITCDTIFNTKNLEFFKTLAGTTVKGFIFRLYNPGRGFNHVLAACICDGQLHVCNSWNIGCQTNMFDVFMTLTNAGQLKLWIKNIGILLVRD